jgi:hypothetical protein
MLIRDADPGTRVYVKKGWRQTATRDHVIRKRHREYTRRHRRKMNVSQSVSRLAYDFRLSRRRVEQIIYR